VAERVDRERRRFIVLASMTAAAAHLTMSGSAKATIACHVICQGYQAATLSTLCSWLRAFKQGLVPPAGVETHRRTRPYS
jgi:hypothetical protein